MAMDFPDLHSAHLMLLFTPELCGANDPLKVLAGALPEVDLVQVRLKSKEHPSGPAPARELFDWTRAVLAIAATSATPVLVNDRVDVALALRSEGCAGVHLGQGDMPAAEARKILGPDAIIGLSTGCAKDLVRAQDEPVNYLGFGPIFPTATKGYEKGHGPEAAWIAQTSSALPIFPIGGIDESSASSLSMVGRAAVSSAILSADNPRTRAALIRSELLSDADEVAANP